MNILARFPSSIFQDIETFLRTEVGLVEGEIRLVLVGYNSSIITCEILPSLYTFNDLSEFLTRNFQPGFDWFNHPIDFE